MKLKLVELQSKKKKSLLFIAAAGYSNFLFFLSDYRLLFQFLFHINLFTDSILKKSPLLAAAAAVKSAVATKKKPSQLTATALVRH